MSGKSSGGGGFYASSAGDTDFRRTWKKDGSSSSSSGGAGGGNKQQQPPISIENTSLPQPSQGRLITSRPMRKPEQPGGVIPAENVKKRKTKDDNDDEGETTATASIDKQLLKARESKIDFTSNLNKTLVVDLSEGARQPGFYCEACDRTYKDSLAFLDHINTRRHQENIGVTMESRRSTLEEVKARVEFWKKRQEDGGEEMKYDLESRVKKIMAEEAEEKDRRREARVQAKKEKEQQVKEKLAEQGLGDDIDVMAAMGFGGFGSTKQ